ncbi:hypothetical protein [Pseudorhodoferax sp. Leaf267]|uniref:hypothetical protein n=1 Tax=Pseudorhodoferax sp. Leaf267 TaxID=1736316 RepID=UPI0006FB2565|nr:hypothetical protein [Pseudorhodoferax sp. Leaf267]KQP14159.1 hypothetical protein ASF43_15090 [Pseudorhodoferax sp. Leaf267]
MRSEVSVELVTGQRFSVDLEEVQPMPHDQARQWLDAQFTQLECEPLRATGKVLLVDKLIAIAQAAGPSLLGDAQWLADFARAASAALAKPVVRVDLGAMAISY